MRRLSIKAALGVFAVVALAAGRDFAQDAAAPDSSQPQAPPQYRVEIILFANQDANPQEELFSAEEPKPASATDTPLPVQPLPPGDEDEAELQSVPGGAALPASGIAPAPPASGTAVAPLPSATAASPTGAGADAGALQPVTVPQASGDKDTTATQPFHFSLLTPDEMQLDDAYAKLGRLGAYQVLGHAGWVQEGLPQDQTVPIDMAALGIANPSGTIQLYVSRFPHVIVNLTYRTPPAATAEQSTPDPSGLAMEPVSAQYVLRQQRRVKSGDIQYFDHPMFGLLLLITPVPQKPAQPAEDGGTLKPAA